MMRKYMTMFIVLLVSSLSIMAQKTVKYGYSEETEQVKTWGTGKAETYNVAIKIDNPHLKGLKVSALRIPFKAKSGEVSACAAFLTRKLQVKKGKVIADIATVEFTPGEEWITVKFPQAYVITDDVFYAGYTFKVNNLTVATKSPIITVPGEHEAAFIVTTSRTYRSWKDLSPAVKQYSPLNIVLQGDFQRNAVLPIKLAESRIRSGQEGKAEAVIANMGLADVKSVDYIYEVGGKKHEGHIDLSSPLSSKLYASTVPVEVSLPVMTNEGNFKSKLVITRVNGETNAQKDAFTNSVVNVISFTPLHRAVMEEFTGTWCGWCPRGWVAIELLKERYPDRFIALAYHKDDIMQTTKALPVSISGFPSASIDRGPAYDPYFGNTSNKNMGIEDLWKAACEIPAPANISVKADLTADQKEIMIQSEVVFAENQDEHPYRLSYYVTADGLTGSSKRWTQTNYYSGDKKAGDDFKKFIEGGKEMRIEFNDVVIARTDYAGVEGSVPTPIKMDEAITHQYKFALDDMKTIFPVKEDPSLVQDVNKLNVVVLIVNTKTGKIENAAKCHVNTGETGLIETETDENVFEVARYSIDGRRVDANHKGFCIVRMSNGKVKKVLNQ